VSVRRKKNLLWYELLMPTSGILRVRTRFEDLEVSFSFEDYSRHLPKLRNIIVVKWR